MNGRIIVVGWAVAWATYFPSRAANGQEKPAAGDSNQAIAPVTADQPSISAEETVQMARDAFDQLETVTDAGARQEVLARIQQQLDVLRVKAPNHPWLPYLAGRAYSLMDRRGDAADQLLKFVQSREGQTEWRAFRTLGNQLVDEFPQLAKGYYEKAAALKPNDASILHGLSLCAAKLGQKEEAVRLGKEAVAADGGATLRYVAHLSGVLRNAGQWEEASREATRATELARQAVERQPGEEEPLRALDGLLQQRIDLLQARIAAETSAVSDTYLALAGALEDRLETQRRLNLFNVWRVLETGVNESSPNSPPSLLERYAVALAEVGRTQQAIEAFEKLLVLDVHNPVAAEWLARLRP